MSTKAEEKYLEQFEVVPYAMKIEKADLMESEPISLRLKVVLQSRSWSNEGASRIQIDSVSLTPHARILSDAMFESDLVEEGAFEKMGIEVELAERAMVVDFDREVAICEFDLAIIGFSAAVSPDVSYEERQHCLMEFFSSLTLTISYSVENSRAKVEEKFRSICTSSCVNWRKIFEA